MLSIIVPYYNSERFIEPFLSTWKFQNNLFEFNGELIFVNNASTDSSAYLLREGVKKLDYVRLIDYNEKKSSYAARNYGVRHSRFNHLAFLDIDVLLSKDWLKYALEFTGTTDIVAGDVQLIPDSTISQRYDSVFSFDLKKYASENTGITANLLVVKSVFEELNGFMEVSSGGDRDFCRRSALQGNSFSFQPTLLCNHPCRNHTENIIKIKRLATGKIELLQGKTKLWVTLEQLTKMIFQRNTFMTVVKNYKSIGNSLIPLFMYSYGLIAYSRLYTIYLLWKKDS